VPTWNKYGVETYRSDPKETTD